MNLDLNEVASERRVAAVRIARDLASEDDLVTLLGVAKHGLGELFDGECTIQLAWHRNPWWAPSRSGSRPRACATR